VLFAFGTLCDNEMSRRAILAETNPVLRSGAVSDLLSDSSQVEDAVWAYERGEDLTESQKNILRVMNVRGTVMYSSFLVLVALPQFIPVYLLVILRRRSEYEADTVAAYATSPNDLLRAFTMLGGDRPGWMIFSAHPTLKCRSKRIMNLRLKLHKLKEQAGEPGEPFFEYPEKLVNVVRPIGGSIKLRNLRGFIGKKSFRALLLSLALSPFIGEYLSISLPTNISDYIFPMYNLDAYSRYADHTNLLSAFLKGLLMQTPSMFVFEGFELVFPSRIVSGISAALLLFFITTSHLPNRIKFPVAFLSFGYVQLCVYALTLLPFSAFSLGMSIYILAHGILDVFVLLSVFLLFLNRGFSAANAFSFGCIAAAIVCIVIDMASPIIWAGKYGTFVSHVERTAFVNLSRVAIWGACSLIFSHRKSIGSPSPT